MKVILLKDVGGVGQRNTLADVADGYGMNFLIARGLAVQATAARVAALESQLEKVAQQHAKEELDLSVRIKSLEGARIEITVRATEKGGLFKSLGASDITRAIQDQKSVTIPEEAVALEKPIKTLGEHSVKINAHDARADITLTVNGKS